MTEKLLPVKQYYPQTDSQTGHSYRMCFSSTCSMGLKFLFPDSLQGSNADDNYLKTVFKYGDTTSSAAQIKALYEYGVVGSFGTNGTRKLIESEINKGYPVGVGFLHHGPVSAPRGGGHWILAIGYSDSHIICHDPYGELDTVNGGYVTIGSGGKEVRYSWRNWLPRWEVDGPGSGWYITFRPMSNQPTLFDNDWSRVIAAADAAGAAYPQVVAAQWALESNWGKITSGKNNYFGIKGRGTIVSTQEWINGKFVTIKDEFQDFSNLQECVAYLVTRWYKDYGAYRGVNRAKSVEECCNLLVQEGYATDPEYAKKLLRIIKERT